MKLGQKTLSIAKAIAAMLMHKKPYVQQPGAGVARAKARESAYRKQEAKRLKNAMAVKRTRQQERSYAIRGR